MKDISICGKDIDDLLAYSTPKKVKIRDRRLCCGRILVILGVFFYVVIWAVIVKKGYLETEPPSGFVRISLRSNPTGESSPYCGAQEETSSGLKYGKLPCIQWGNYEAVYPEGEEISFLLSTRVTMTTWEANNDPTNPATDCFLRINDCMGGTPSKVSTPYYIPEVEKYTVMFTHTVYGRNTETSFTNLEMDEGLLLDHDDEEVRDFVAARKKLGEGAPPGDIVSMSELMDLVDHSLDEESLASSGETLRFGGVVILCIIEYKSATLSMSDLEYTMRFIAIDGIEDKYEQVLWRDFEDKIQRVVVNRHGIRVVVIQTGTVGKFSFIQLLRTLVTAVALMGVADFVVDHIIMKVLPLKRVYKNYKYIKTVDFSEVKKVSKHSNEFTVQTHKGKSSYRLEAHDFVYGTLLRGGHQDKPEWPLGAGPHAASAKADQEAQILGEPSGAAGGVPGGPPMTTTQAYPQPVGVSPGAGPAYVDPGMAGPAPGAPPMAMSGGPHVYAADQQLQVPANTPN